MSPGIVRFYFDSKAAMLVASLQFLAAEFEEQVLVPVSKLKSRPVAALELMVDLYLDPEIASPRKVSVWYAFWGEASSRQEYYDICGQKDESFAALVRELIGRLIEETAQPHLDPGRNRARPHRGAGNAVAGLCLSKRGQYRPAGREAPLHGLSALDLPRTLPIVCARTGGRRHRRRSESISRLGVLQFVRLHHGARPIVSGRGANCGPRIATSTRGRLFGRRPRHGAGVARAGFRRKDPRVAQQLSAAAAHAGERRRRSIRRRHHRLQGSRPQVRARRAARRCGRPLRFERPRAASDAVGCCSSGRRMRRVRARRRPPPGP